MKALILGLVGLYRKAVSPLLPGCCRFQPTCSHYALEAVERYGVLRGLALAGRRLVRCAPWCPGGYDPVPVPRTSERNLH